MSADVTSPPLLREQFRESMRRFAATVSVITTLHRGERVGMTVSSVVSLSMDPPSLAMCINRASSCFEALQESRIACVNVLAAEQAPLCEAFSQRDAKARFDHGSWGIGALSLPYLDGAHANIAVRLTDQVRKSTHEIFIGEVIEVRLGTSRLPLLYLGGGTTTVVPVPDIAVSRAAAAPITAQPVESA